MALVCQMCLVARSRCYSYLKSNMPYIKITKEKVTDQNAKPQFQLPTNTDVLYVICFEMQQPGKLRSPTRDLIACSFKVNTFSLACRDLSVSSHGHIAP